MLQCSKKSGSWLGKSHLHLNYKHTPNVWWKSAETKFSDIEITARQESTQMYNWLKPDLGEIQLKGFPFSDRPPAPGSICDANSSRRIGFSDRSHISSQSGHITLVIPLPKSNLQIEATYHRSFFILGSHFISQIISPIAPGAITIPKPTSPLKATRKRIYPLNLRYLSLKKDQLLILEANNEHWAS